MNKTWILIILGTVVAYLGYRVFFANKKAKGTVTSEVIGEDINIRQASIGSEGIPDVNVPTIV